MRKNLQVEVGRSASIGEGLAFALLGHSVVARMFRMHQITHRQLREPYGRPTKLIAPCS